MHRLVYAAIFPHLWFFLQEHNVDWTSWKSAAVRWQLIGDVLHWEALARTGKSTRNLVTCVLFGGQLWKIISKNHWTVNFGKNMFRWSFFQSQHIVCNGKEGLLLPALCLSSCCITHVRHRLSCTDTYYVMNATILSLATLPMWLYIFQVRCCKFCFLKSSVGPLENRTRPNYYHCLFVRLGYRRSFKTTWC